MQEFSSQVLGDPAAAFAGKKSIQNLMRPKSSDQGIIALANHARGQCRRHIIIIRKTPTQHYRCVKDKPSLR